MVDFLGDATRTILSFASIIERAPLQTYASLLIFSPVASQVRQKFWDQRLPPHSYIEGVRSNWDAYIQTPQADFHVQPSFETERFSVGSFCFSPNGKLLLIQPDRDTVQILDLRTWKVIRRLTDDKGLDNIQFSPDSRLLAYKSFESNGIWDLGDGTKKPMLENQMETLLTLPVVYSTHNQVAAVGYNRGTLKLWDTAGRGHVSSPQRDADPIYEIAFSPNGKFLASLSGDYASLSTDGTIRVWDAETRIRQCSIRQVSDCHSRRLLLSTNGEVLSSPHPSGPIDVWDAETGAHQRTLEFIGERIGQYALSPNSMLLAIVISSDSPKSGLNLYNAKTAKHQCTLHHFDFSKAVQIVFTSDSRIVARASDDRTIRLWDTTTYKLLHTFQTYHSTPEMTTFSHNGSTIAVASKDRSIRVWDVTTGRLRQMIYYDEGFIQDLSVLPDQVIISVSDVESDRLWDPWETQSFKLSKYSYPFSANIQPSVQERFLSGLSLDVDECWIMQGCAKVILLPYEYRPVERFERRAGMSKTWIQRGSLLFIASLCGRLICFRC